jgi:hypothetical protein
MKKLLLTSFIGLLANAVTAQLYVSNGAMLFIDNGASVTVNGGDVTTNAAITGAGTGKLLLNGSSLQNIYNNGFKIFGLEVSNTANVLMNHNLEVDGILTLTNGALQVNGKQLTLSGTALGNTGTITGSALSELFINGSGTFGTLYFTGGSTNNLFKNITLNRTGNASLGSSLRISDVVTITNGTLNSNGNLILQSNATNTARVAIITAGNGISGNVVTERFIVGGASNAAGATPGRRAFRFISHPFNTYTDLRQLTNQIDVTGSGATATPTDALFTQTSTNAPSSFWYNPMASDGNVLNDAGWTAFTNALPANANDANAWKVGAGVRVLVRGAKGEGLAGGSYTASNVTMSMTGPLNVLTTPLNYNLQTNGSGLGYGWNLIGNPLASPVEVQTKLKTLRESNIGGVNSNLNATAYVWNPNKSNTSRGGWDAIDLTTAADYNLPMHSVVLVQTTTNNNTVLSFSESDKTANTASNLFRTQNLANALGIELQDSVGTVLDETFIRFNGNATKNFDSYDGGKLVNQYALFSRTANNTNTYLQSLPTPTQNDSIALGVRSSEAKTFKLAISDYNPPTGMQLFLKDKKLQTIQPITAGFAYNYSVTSDTATQGDNRFEIVMKSNAALPIAGINIKAAQQNSSTIKVDYTVLSETNMDKYEIEKSNDGVSFTKGIAQAATGNINTNTSYTWLDNNINASGNNYYRIKAFGKNGSTQYSNIVNVKLIGKSNIAIVPNLVVDKKAMIQFTNMEKGMYNIGIYNSAGQKMLATTVQHIGGSAMLPIALSNMAAGNYNVIVENANTSKTIKIIVQ